MATIGAAVAGVAISAGLKLLGPALQDLALRLQERFGHNNGTGPVKIETLTDLGQVLADKLSTAGQIPGVLDRTAILTIAETVVQDLKRRGLLPSSDAPAAPAATPAAATLAGGTYIIQVLGKV